MKKAIVVGSGIAGLATALRLSQDGWSVLIVERATGRRSGGYMMNLFGPGYDAAEHLGIIPSLSERALGMFTAVLVHADGRPKVTMPAAFAEAALGARALSVFRGDLETVLYEEIESRAEVRFGSTVVAIEQDEDRVRVTLSDGFETDADLLVGADGLHSSIRDTVFGTNYRVDMPYVVAACRLEKAVEEIPSSSAITFIDIGRTAGVVNLGPERSSAFFTYRCDDPEAELVRGPAGVLRDAFGDVGAGVPDVIHQLEKDSTNTYFDRVSQVVMPSWHKGRVVLLGDSAWCTSLFAGHGGSLALEGADKLGSALKKHGDDIPTALSNWELGLRPDVVKRQGVAQQGVRYYAPSNRLQLWMNEMSMRLIVLPGVRTIAQWGIRRKNR